MDGADVCRTSSRASRRPPDVISTIAILNPRWRRRKWRHPGPGARFSIPIEEWGGKWRPFRFRSPSWVTSFVGTGNEVIQDGRRKRKGRHFPPHSSMGIEKRALYYLGNLPDNTYSHADRSAPLHQWPPYWIEVHIFPAVYGLAHWGQVMHIYISTLSIIGSDEPMLEHC